MKLLILALGLCALSSCGIIPEICWAAEEICEVVEHPKPPVREAPNAIS